MAIRKWQLPFKIAHLHYLGPKDFIVAHPIKPGLQTCVIREVKPGYKRILAVKDALVDVPGCPLKLEPYPDPEFAGYLGIANAQYKKEIQHASQGGSSARLSPTAHKYSGPRPVPAKVAAPCPKCHSAAFEPC